jgi:hypothetical protein
MLSKTPTRHSMFPASPARAQTREPTRPVMAQVRLQRVLP